MNVVSHEVGVRELRLQLSRYLSAVKEGQELVVTEHGHPIARLIPTQANSTRLADLIAHGDAEAAQIKHDDWLPEPIELAQGVIVSDLAAEQRR